MRCFQWNGGKTVKPYALQSQVVLTLTALNHRQRSIQHILHHLPCFSFLFSLFYFHNYCNTELESKCVAAVGSYSAGCCVVSLPVGYTVTWTSSANEIEPEKTVDTATVISLIRLIHLFLSNVNRSSLNYLKIALALVDLGSALYNNLRTTRSRWLHHSFEAAQQQASVTAE